MRQLLTCEDEPHGYVGLQLGFNCEGGHLVHFFCEY